MEATQTFISVEWTQKLCWIHTMDYYSEWKEANYSDSNIDEPQNSYAKWTKPDQKVHIL